MHVIGTAGHVDHGKSTLVKALSGIDPDRLKEEQKREMTIDLGFAWMTLPNGLSVGIVDVPGHRDFIENMLSGMGGIEMVILVIAADEGVMPQTREHLAILDLLGIQAGVVALTKIDLVNDDRWLELVKEEIRQLLACTTLEQLEIIPVSARNGQGLEQLINQIQIILNNLSPRLDSGRPRLPIDRVFSLQGFGTVVTGTLLDGKLKIGDEIEILPGEIRGRIRGLQTHKEKEEVALPGSRTAVNIAGVETSQIKRGDVLVKTDTCISTRRLDANLKVLSNLNFSIKHNAPVKLFIGAAEINTRIRILGQEEIQPGKKGYIQLELDTPTVAITGDHFILRRPSPAETLGGGTVLDPFPVRRHKRFAGNIIEALQLLENGSPADVLVQTSQKYGPMSMKELFDKSNINPLNDQEIWLNLQNNKKLVCLESGDPVQDQNLLVISIDGLHFFQQKVLQELKSFFSKNPLRQGMKIEELKSRFQFTGRAFDALINYLIQDNVLQETKNLIFPFERKIQFSSEQSRLVASLMEQFAAHPYDPPSVSESMRMVGKDVYQALLDMAELVQVSSDVVFRMQEYQKMITEILSLLRLRGTITLAEIRDKYQTSRRFALAFLEHMDSLDLTVRDGDMRRMKNKMKNSH